jgi:hypothetical protein
MKVLKMHSRFVSAQEANEEAGSHVARGSGFKYTLTNAARLAHLHMIIAAYRCCLADGGFLRLPKPG